MYTHTGLIGLIIHEILGLKLGHLGQLVAVPGAYLCGNLHDAAVALLVVELGGDLHSIVGVKL